MDISRGIQKYQHLYKTAFKKSSEIHPDYKILPTTFPVTQKTVDLMSNSTEAMHFNKLSTGSTLRGVTNSCKVMLGSVLSIDIDADRKGIGEFRVIDIIHRHDIAGRYENEIVAINAKLSHAPYHNVKQPTALPEPAIVNDNEDPRGMGRVKVQFMWQNLDGHPSGRTSE